MSDLGNNAKVNKLFPYGKTEIFESSRSMNSLTDNYRKNPFVDR